MTMIRDITGEYDRAALDRLLWPVAWSGTVDAETRAAEESALSDLVDEAREALASDPDAVAVRIEAGAVVSTVHAAG
jgi:hypothetical protein